MTRPQLHAYHTYAGLTGGTRIVLSEYADRDRAQVSEAFITADPEALVEVVA